MKRNKNKKYIMNVSLLIMLVGMITFPIDVTGLKAGVAETVGDKPKQEETTVAELTVTPLPTDTPMPTSTPTPSPTPTIELPKPEENALNEEVPQEIIELVDKYLNYPLNESVDQFKTLYSNPELVDEELYDRRVEYITAYHNVKCYTKKGAGEVDYVVYFTSDAELATISTYVPSAYKLLVKYDDGEPKIYVVDGTERDEVIDYFYNLDSTVDVVELINDVNQRLVEALNADADLRAMVDRMTAEQEENSNHDDMETENGVTEE